MSLDDLENKYFKKSKQKTNMIFEIKNNLSLPSKKLYEIKSAGDTSCLELSLLWTSKAQKNGICVMIDNEFNCWPDRMKKHNINLSELLYVPCAEPDDIYEILFKLLRIKEIHLIVISTIGLLFPLIYDIQWFTTKFTRLKECVQESEASILILNPYHDLRYDIFNKSINRQFKSSYKSKNKDNVEINVISSGNFGKNHSFLSSINYIH